MTLHNLKILPEHYEAVTHFNPLKRKTVEIRREDDREFAVGDVLHLNEWDAEANRFTWRSSSFVVTHILRGAPFVPEGYAALSITPMALRKELSYD
ncbi:DUF3850 domain-containing protein [Paenibacillus sp. 8b26]|uniref:DUF3850 domain-containing protein n=1 Tax=Paenibacillus sp. 8b26 TaxID=3424133 RepID=UPI003D648FE3